MARARNLKPSLFKNEKLAELGPYAILLFEGLWCLADRRGRLEDRPKRIKIEILPYFDCDCDDLLRLLHEEGFIWRYSVGGIGYIQVLKFEKHQNPHKNEAESTIPEPELHSTSTVQEPKGHSSNRADSLNLVTDSLNLVTDSSKEVVVDDARAHAEIVFAEVMGHYVDTVGTMPPPMVSVGIQSYLDHMDADVVIDAIDRAAAENKRTWSYVNAILKSRKESGIRNMADVAREDEEYKRSKMKSRDPPGEKRPRNVYSEFAEQARREELERIVVANDET